jgi:hypothetical protein
MGVSEDLINKLEGEFDLHARYLYFQIDLKY